MKAMLATTFFLSLLVGCGPATPTATPPPVCTPPACPADEVLYCPGECPGGCGTTCATPTLTPVLPPADATRYDGCAFIAYVPSQLESEDLGFMLHLVGREQKKATLSIEAWRQTGAVAEEVAAGLVREISGREAVPTFDPVTVTDFIGQPLQGVEVEFAVGDELLHVLVVVRPETLMANMLPDDAVYTIVARAPAGEWDEWAPVFEVVLSTFTPLDCGGV